MDLLGLLAFLVIGLVAGAATGWFIGVRTTQGLTPTLAVGAIAGMLGGLAALGLGASTDRSYMGAAIAAILAAIVVRVALKVREGRS